MPEGSTPSAAIPTKQVFVTPDEIGSINTVLLTNAEHYEFINDVLMRLETETALIANPAVKAAKERFANAHKEENRCLILSKRSELTEDIKTADAERDKLYVSYRLAVRSALSHPVAANGTENKADHLVRNMPSELTAIIPSLTAGKYHIKLVTQYSGGTKELKTTKSLTYDMELTVS